MMEKMLALVSHDVRNPLATVRMAVQVLVDPANDKQREARAVILRNLEQADGIIQSLLDVASIRAGRPIPLEFRTCDLAAEVRRIVTEQVVAGGKRVELVAHDGLWGEWAVGGIVRALQNLIGNAVKYGAPATPILVRLTRDDGRVLLSVHNQGEPIAPGDQRAIFRPFQRTARSERSNTKGWGLGLAIVQAVAEAHGGDVVVESSASSGTTFTLELPIRSAEQRS
jgi:signal transduction histidine kinase